jgi:hypothetical protein
MLFTIFRPDRAHTFEARMQRARNDGYTTGAGEEQLFKIAIGNVVFEREQVLNWLNAAVHEGRFELRSQHVFERVIEAWDMSFRIGFLVAIV